MATLPRPTAPALAAATLVGLVLLWPGDVESQFAGGIVVDSEKAEVEKVEERICAGFAEQECQDATVRLRSGPDAGKRARIQLGTTGALDPDLDPGDEIRVAEAPQPPPGTEAVPALALLRRKAEPRGRRTQDTRRSEVAREHDSVRPIAELRQATF